MLNLKNFEEVLTCLKKEVETTITDIVIKSNFDENIIRKSIKEIVTIQVYDANSIEMDCVVRIEPNTVESIVVPFEAQVKFMLSIDEETQEVSKNIAFGLCTIGKKSKPQQMFDVDYIYNLYVNDNEEYSLSDFIA